MKRIRIAIAAFVSLVVLTPSVTSQTESRSETLNRELEDALSKPDLKLAAALIAKGADVNAHLSTGNLTHLMAALWRRDDLPVVRFLLDHKASLKEQGIEHGTTALEYACSIDGPTDLKVVSLLIDAGADVNEKSGAGEWTPLMRAAGKGDEPLVRLLISRGASVKMRGPNGNSALQQAASVGSTSVAQILIDHGLSVNDKNSFDQTPLVFAAGSGHLDIIKLLLRRGAKVDARERQGWTPMFWACLYGQAQAVKLLLDHGANVNTKDEYGLTPLIEAALCGDLPTIKLLIKRGADVTAKAKKGETALSLAIEHKHTEAAALLKAHAKRRGTGTQPH